MTIRSVANTETYSIPASIQRAINATSPASFKATDWIVVAAVNVWPPMVMPGWAMTRKLKADFGGCWACCGLGWFWFCALIGEEFIQKANSKKQLMVFMFI